jgi:hypothetical protein
MKSCLFLVSVLVVASLFAGVAQGAIVRNLEWSPSDPKVGDTVTVTCFIDGNTSGGVRLKYCPTPDVCYFADMTNNSGVWSTTFTAADAGQTEISVVVDDVEAKSALITVKEKGSGSGTPGFELLVVLLAVALTTTIISGKRL